MEREPANRFLCPFRKTYLFLFRTDDKTHSVIDAYLNKQISLDELKTEFKKLDPDLMDGKLFHILEVLYEGVDVYSALWTAEDFARAPYLLNEQGLRKEVGDALTKLRNYLASHDT
jgi:hypothetical protein